MQTMAHWIALCQNRHYYLLLPMFEYSHRNMFVLYYVWMTHLPIMFLHSGLIWEYRIRLVAMDIPLYRFYMTNWDILKGRFRLCNWMSLWCLGLWINHSPAVYQSFLPVPDQKHLLTVEYHIHTWRAKDSYILSGRIVKDFPHSNSKDPGMVWWWWCRDPH